MAAEFYKGESLLLRFATKVPIEGARPTITGFDIKVVIQGFFAQVTIKDDYTFEALFAPTITKLFQPKCDIVLQLIKDSSTTIGKVSQITAIDPINGKVIDAIESVDLTVIIDSNVFEFDVDMHNIFTYSDLTTEQKQDIISGITAQAEGLFVQLNSAIDNANDIIYILNQFHTQAEAQEGTRQSAETSREGAEQTRQTNETNRQTAESSRVTAESNRVTQENDRIAAENLRESNEDSRISAEAARVTAENARVSGGAITQANNKQEIGISTTNVMSQKAITDLTVISSYGDKTAITFTPTTFAIKTDGTTVSSPSFYTSDLMRPIDPRNKYYQFGRYIYTAGYLRIAFYDANQVFISGQTPAITTIYAGEEITGIPSNAAFMSICNVNYNAFQPSWTIGLSLQVYQEDTVKEKVTDLLSRSINYDTIYGKNKLNPATVTDGKYISDAAGTLSNSASGIVSDFIEWGSETIARFKTYDGTIRTTAYFLQYDSGKNPISASYQNTQLAMIRKYSGAVYFKVTCFVFGDTSFKDALKWMIYFGNDSTISFEPYYAAKLFKKDSSNNQAYFTPDPNSAVKPVTTKIITVKRLGTSGIDADFCGLNAIGDALASITDASEIKRYKLLCEGYFLFTQTTDFIYKDSYNEWSVLVSKRFVDVEGVTQDKFAIVVDLQDNLDIDYGKYQPVMWNYETLKNLTIVARNCRYALHIEGGAAAYNTIANIVNVNIAHLGNYNNAAVSQNGSTAWTSTNAIGAGIEDGQIINLKNLRLNSVQQNDFHFHSPLHSCTNNYYLNVDNCVFSGKIPFGINLYPTTRKFIVNINNPVFNTNKKVGVATYISTTLNTANYYDIDLFIDSKAIAFFNNVKQNSGLRIKSKSTGVNSIVTVDKNCTAFAIIGNVNEVTETQTKWLTSKKYGYEYRNGAIGSSGFIIGHSDVNEETTHSSLGKILGDCSSTNKTLSVTVDGIAYNVVFNQNCTSLTNAQVIALITAVIGNVADVDIYPVGIDFLPDFSGVTVYSNADSTEIKAGMGVIFNGINTIRKALNSDNYIDGIALDSCGVGQSLRVACRDSEIYTMYSGFRFSLLEINSISRTVGSMLGISTTQPGYFDPAATPKLVRIINADIAKIL